MTDVQAAPRAAPAPPHVPSWRLLLTMGGGGAIAGLVIVLVYLWTVPRVEAYKALVLRSAIAEVLHDPARCDTLWLVAGALTDQRPDGDAVKGIERVFLGYDAAGGPVGFAIVAAKPGFADRIELIFGYDASARRVLGVKVLAHKETPGIADKVMQPVFTERLRGREVPLEGVRAGGGSGTADSARAVEMITGATISSRAVIRGINEAIARWQPILDAYAARAGGV